MAKNYFDELRKTKNGFWINNPTAEEMKLALDHGVIAGTTNPAYCSNLIARDKEYSNKIIDEVIKEEKDAEKAAGLVYQRAAKSFMDAFMGVYRETGGKYGYVTMQSDPRVDEDKDRVIRDINVNRKLSPNYMAKIPVIVGSVDAIEYCVEQNIPVCATEVFAISQMVYICELYEKASRRTGNKPPFFVTHITGIFDEYLGKVVKRQNIDIAPEILSEAGLAIARKEYWIMKDRGYSAHLLGGGVRWMEHFTGMMGGDAHVTINWSTAVEVMDSPVQLTDEIYKKVPEEVISELRAKLPVFQKPMMTTACRLRNLRVLARYNYLGTCF